MESTDFKIEETDKQLIIQWKDDKIKSVIDKWGWQATLYKTSPTWKYIEYLRNRIKELEK